MMNTVSGKTPNKQGPGSRFGAFWRKNKRNKVIVVVAALILFSIIRSVIGGIGSPDIDTEESYDPTTNVTTQTTTEAEKETTAETKEKKSDDGVDADFKETMDEYEEFMNEYVEFMKKYENSNDTAGMLVDYGKMMTQYAEFSEKIDAIDEDELSDADYAYYMKVTGRVNEKLAELY